jgi:hypothetical protein
MHALKGTERRAMIKAFCRPRLLGVPVATMSMWVIDKPFRAAFGASSWYRPVLTDTEVKFAAAIPADPRRGPGSCVKLRNYRFQ